MTMLSRSPLRSTTACTSSKCRRGRCGLDLGLGLPALDRLHPLHVIVDPDGTILHAGPTLRRLVQGTDVVGTSLFAHLDLRRPRGRASIAALTSDHAGPLRFALRDETRTPLKGMAVPLTCRRAVLITLSFGISVVDAVARYRLTSQDFAPTDLAIEMLFVVEAQTALLEESRKLNARLQTARLAAEQEAATDRRTRLRNRRAIEHLLARLVEQGVPFGLIHVDLDHFKAVNDTHGHAAGDAVLREVAQRLRDCVRARDTVSRLGGDEFVIVLHGLTNPARLADLAGRIVAALDVPVDSDGAVLRVSASVGVTATSFYDRPDTGQMQRDADAALYAAKHAGRRRFVIAAPGES